MRITGNATIDRVLLGRAGNRLPLSYSDTFARADGAMGGRWQGANWAIASGHAVGTPTLGAELLTDGGVENWSSATNLTSWSKQVGGTSTINRDEIIKHAGNYSARVDVDALNTSAYIQQSLAISAGDWVAVSWWGYASDAAKSLGVQIGTTGAWQGTVRTPGASWTNYTDTMRCLAGASLVAARRVAISSSVYFDDMSVRKISLSSMLSGVRMARPNMDVSAAAYRVTSTQFGVFSCLDSLTAPANGVFAYMDGAGNLKLDKLVAGVWTNVASAAVTYVAGALVRLKQLGSTFTIYYNGTQLGTTSTISDATVVNNTIAGLMSTYSGNYATSFSAAPAT